MTLQVAILGALRVERDGAPIEIAGTRLRALLARLALSPDAPVSATALVDAIWDGDLPADEQHALQSLISRARRALKDPDAIVPAAGGYRLVAEVDAARFETLADAGAASLRAGDPQHAAATLEQALELWHGPALADLQLEPLRVAAARLEDRRADALADRAEAELALGDGAHLLSELDAALTAHPLHERLAARQIGALYAAGRQADALAAYERIRRRLLDELGAAPSPDLQAAHLAVLKGEARQRRGNLRAPVTSFVGREPELRRIHELLGRERLVTLVGPGGAGKTRLANEALRTHSARDGVWLVELAPVTAEVELVPAVLGALGLRDPALVEGTVPRAGLERLVDMLAERETVLLLDNCEHLIGAAAELADRLLADCPRLKLVATSREPLAIAGEHLVPVPPLEAAAQLFRDRAAAASPDAALDDDLIEEICRRLDGLPLAIELAAARLRTMPIEQLAARLDDRFRLLTGGSRAALPRHRTLRAVVDWSWGLLSEPERALARRLAVFSGGVTEESAAAVDGDFDGLAALADRSLLQVDGDRYRMLETIREYALEKLDEADELHATRTGHARYFADLVERTVPRLRGPAQQGAFTRLQTEHDDVIAALRWLGDSGDRRAALRLAVALLWFWGLSGAQDEARAWIEFALAVAGDADSVDLLMAEGVVELFRYEGDLRPITALAERVERERDDRPLLALARVALAFLQGDMPTAEARLAEALEHPDPWTRAAAVVMRAHLAENTGDQVHMRADLERGAAMFRDLGDAWALGLTLSSQASSLTLAGDLDGAETVLDEAAELLSSLSGSGAMLWLRLADIRLRRGDFAGARELTARLLERGDVGRDTSVLVRTLLARIAWLEGDGETLRRLVAEARERLDPRRPDQGHERALVEALSALAAMDDGDLVAAAARLEAGLEAAVASRDMPMVAMVGTVAAAFALRAGRHDEAAERLGAAAVLRGAEDRSEPEIGRLLRVLDGPAYERGRALDREAALALVSCPPGVGA